MLAYQLFSISMVELITLRIVHLLTIILAETINILLFIYKISTLQIMNLQNTITYMKPILQTALFMEIKT